jgi:glycerol uptake facilitator-like aquaporin
VRFLVPAGIAGVLVGWLTASWVSDRAITLLIALVGLGFCLNLWLRKNRDAPALPPQRAKGWFWGTVAGFTSFISHAGAPPFQVYMLPQQLPKAEFAGTAVLVCVVVGSGIMGTNLSEDLGVALIINTISTIFALALLILTLGPISGAHFNPAVSLVQLVSRAQKPVETLVYVVVQVAGAIVGAILANVMFDQPAVQFSTNDRVSPGMLLGEVIATAGLIAIIGVLSFRKQDALIPVAVAAWIGSAYFFTSSTSFANPAVTIGRLFSNTFAGIDPASVAPYIGAQLLGALLGFFIVKGVVRA